jgi:hypothetical protein
MKRSSGPRLWARPRTQDQDPRRFNHLRANLAQGTSCTSSLLGASTRHLILDWHLLGTWYFVLGTWYLVALYVLARGTWHWNCGLPPPPPRHPPRPAGGQDGRCHVAMGTGAIQGPGCKQCHAPCAMCHHVPCATRQLVAS